MKLSTRVEPIRYYGSLQGFKVYIGGKKYPREHGHFYATMDANKAVKSAIKERRTSKKQYK